MKNLYPNFHPCPAAHHVEKFGEVIPTRSKVINLDTLNFAPIFELLLPHIFSGVDTHVFDLTFIAPLISDHLAKFHDDRPRELGDITLQSARNKQKNTSSKT